jgi:predicted transcriptional regulator
MHSDILCVVMPRKVTINKVDTPAPGNIDSDIDFICRSFGYFSQRDKQCTAGKIFRLLVKETTGGSTGIRSEVIAHHLKLTRGAVIHHMNSFLSTGLVIKEKNMYRLRSQSVQRSIEEVKEDINRAFKRLAQIANEIDEKLGNYYR